MSFFDEEFPLNGEGYKKSRLAAGGIYKELIESSGDSMHEFHLVFAALVNRIMSNSNAHQFLLSNGLVQPACAMMRCQIETLLYMFAFYKYPQFGNSLSRHILNNKPLRSFKRSVEGERVYFSYGALAAMYDQTIPYLEGKSLKVRYDYLCSYIHPSMQGLYSSVSAISDDGYMELFIDYSGRSEISGRDYNLQIAEMIEYTCAFASMMQALIPSA